MYRVYSVRYHIITFNYFYNNFILGLDQKLILFLFFKHLIK